MRLDRMIQAIDLHACGEPGRVIVGGVRDVPGRSMFEKMQYLARHHDDLRLRMLREPRGYPAANCNLVLPPTQPEADAGFVIMEQVEYPPMSGTNTICVTTALLETGMMPMREPVTELTLEAPAGLIRVRAECRNGKVTRVSFRNVPAFAVHLDATDPGPDARRRAGGRRVGRHVLRHRRRRRVRPAPDAGRRARHHAHRRADQGGDAGAAAGRPSRRTRRSATSRSRSSRARPPVAGNHRRNAVIVSTGKAGLEPPVDVDRRHRSLAVRHGHLREDGDAARARHAETERAVPARGRARHGLHRHCCSRRRRSGPYRAVVPQLSGTAWITGFAQYVVDPRGSVSRRLHGRRHLVGG